MSNPYQPELFGNESEPAEKIKFTSGSQVDGETFTGIRTEQQNLGEIVFSGCVFRNCLFTKVDFTETSFQECRFISCELVLCKIDGTVFDDVCFESCRLTGINFTDAAEFGFAPNFMSCLLDSCVFFDNNLSRTRCMDSTVRNTDFTNCRLKGIDFSGTRFQSTGMLGCDLEKADLRTASGYTIDPSANKLKGARFSLPEAACFLKYLGITVE